MNKLQIALAFARGEQPVVNDTQMALMRSDEVYKLYSVFLTEDDGDGETESMPFQYIYATRELAKKAIEDHIKEAYDDAHSVEWVGEPGQEICSINWPLTGAWAELRIDEVTLVTE